MKNYYEGGCWTKKQVGDAVAKGWITAEEYREITGEDYVSMLRPFLTPSHDIRLFFRCNGSSLRHLCQSFLCHFPICKQPFQALDKHPSTGDTGGSQTAGTVMAKENAVLGMADIIYKVSCSAAQGKLSARKCPPPIFM